MATQALAAIVFAVLASLPFAATPIGIPSANALTPDRVELDERRTQTSQTFRNADGTFTTSLFAAPVHYRDTQGGWQQIESELVPSSVPGFAYQNKANSFRVHFKEELGEDYLRLQTGGRAYGLSLEGAGRSRSVRGRSGLSYPGAFPGVSVRYDMLADGVKETIVLQRPGVPTHYRFALTADEPDDLRALRGRDGSWSFRRSGSGRPAFVVAPPTVAEAGGHALRTPVALSVKREGKRFVLELTVDPQWLHAPERRFPIALDPTITVQPAILEANWHTSCTDCTATWPPHWIGADAGSVWRSSLKFDLGDLPPNANVTSAAFGLWYDNASCLELTCNQTTHRIDVHRATAPWNLVTTTSSQATFDPAVLASATISPGGVSRWMSWPVTGTMQNWVNGVSPNHGLLVKRYGEGNNVGGPVFPGSDDADAGHRPKLDVTYTSDGVKLYPPDTVHGNGADLKWTAFDGSTGNSFQRYEIHRSADPGFTHSASTLVATLGDVATTVYRDTTAAPNTSYTYKVVVNGSAPSWPRTVTTPAAGTARKTLQLTPDSSRATTIERDTSPSLCANYGADDRLRVGADLYYAYRSLLAFDLRDVPAGARIMSSKLSLYMDMAPSDSSTVTLHRVTADWAEGTGTYACTGDGATWYESQAGVGWTTAGGDFDAAAVASKTHVATDPSGWDDFEIAPAVQLWVDGARPNLGLLLRSTDETNTRYTTTSYVADDESITPDLRPTLTVVYEDGSVSQGPTVSIAAPASAALVKGTAVRVAAAASDDQGVARVEFFADGAAVGTDLTAPYEVFWNSTLVADGQRVLVAKAYDDAGNLSTSAGVTVNVENSAAPTTSVSSVTVPYASEVGLDAPAGWWRLGEPTGTTAADASGNGAAGTYEQATLGAAGALTDDVDTAIELTAGGAATPASDAFATSVLLGGRLASTTGSNAGATVEPTEPQHAGVPGGASLWWTWVAPYSSTVTVTTLGSDFDTVLAVYTGSALGALTQKAANDDDPNAADLTSKVSFAATAGVAYRIAVDGFSAATGLVTLNWTQAATGAPSNNSFAAALALSGGAGKVAGSSTNATKETGEPSHAGNAGGKSVWYSWTAPAAGTVTFDTIGSGFNTLLGIYTGSGVSSLTLVASDNDSGGSLTSKATFTAVSGTTYRVAVDGYAGASGNSVLNWSQPLGRSVDLGDRFDFAGTTPFTLEAWVKPTTIDATARRVFSKETGTGTSRQGYALSVSSSGLLFERVRDGGVDSVASAAGLAANTWSHVAATYDGSTMILYVNGVQAASATAKTRQLLDTTAPARIGRNASSISDQLVGAVDEAAVYTKALSAARVKAHDDSGRGVGTATVRATALVKAAANDDKAVTKVEFYFDDLLIATDTTTPYSASWNTLDEAQPAYDGPHTLTTRAYDAGENVTTSASFAVTVANTANSRFDSGFTATAAPQQVTYDPGATVQEQQGFDVTLTNESGVTWGKDDVVLRSRWLSPDAAVVYTDGPDVSLGTTDVAPGQARTLTVMAEPPTLPDGVNRAQYTLRIDAYSKSTGQWFAAKGNKPVDNPVTVNRNLVRGALGLERYNHYVGSELGAGMQQLVNVANGNSIVRWTPFMAPGRGLSTVVDLTYNALEKKCECPAGNNWSLSISGLTRFGNPLDVHPNNADSIAGRSNKHIEFTDGDGTTHRFTSADGITFIEPAGVHLYLRRYSTTDPTRKWALTRPDRVTFFYDSDGFPTSVEEKNGNRISFALENTPSGEDPGGPKKRITEIVDAGGRKFLLDYYSKAEAKKAHVRGRIQRITDHSGSALDFEYYEDGNLLRIVQRGGTNADGSALADRKFVFTYTTSNGEGPAIPLAADRVDPAVRTSNQSTRLYSVRDPRGAETLFGYLGSGNGDDRWKLASRTDRSGAITTFGYDTTARVTTVTEPLTRVSKYGYDVEGKVTKITNPKNEETLVAWTTARHVQKVTQATGKFVEFAYNQNGYLTDEWDELRNRTQLEYRNEAVDANDAAQHISVLVKKTDPKGTATATPTNDYQWSFGYDAAFKNLTSVTDPLGHASTTTYNADGTVASTRDANGNETRFPSYDANGLVTTVVAADGATTKLGYDDDGLLRWLQDPNHATYPQGTVTTASYYRSEFDYDGFHRLGRQSSPKSTELSPGLLLWSAVDLDANDNLVGEYAPVAATGFTRGTKTTSTYTAIDQLATSEEPPHDPAGVDVDPELQASLRAVRKLSYVYDGDGRLQRIVRPGVAGTNTPSDRIVEYGYDVLDRVVSESRFQVGGTARTSFFCYDLAGDLRWVVAPKAGLANAPSTCESDAAVPAFTSRVGYDATHRAVSQTDALGNVSSVEFDANGDQISGTDELGAKTTREYNERGELVKVVEPFKRDGTGAVTRALTTRLEYDPVGNLRREIGPRAWDASADKLVFADYVTSYVYDAVDRRVKVTLPKDDATRQAFVHSAYDPNGQLLWSSQPVDTDNPALVSPEQKTQVSYFDPGWVRATDDPGKGVVSFDYDSEGRQILRQPTGAPLETWSYYHDGLLRENKDPNGHLTSSKYDLDGNLRRSDDASGVGDASQVPLEVTVRWSEFDEPLEVKQRRNDASAWRTTLSSFDRNGNLDTRTDEAGSAQERVNDFEYDQADRLVWQRDNGAAACADDQRIEHAYLATGWLATRSIRKADAGCGADPAAWPLRQQERTGYFANGQAETLKTWKGAESDANLVSQHTLAYESAGTYLDGNQASDSYLLKGPDPTAPCFLAPCTASYRYDARGRLLESDNGVPTGNTAWQKTSYALDSDTAGTDLLVGNIAAETVSGAGATTRTFTYTASGQLKDLSQGGTLAERYFYAASNGTLRCVTDASGSSPTCDPNPDGTAKPGLLEDYAFDPLERLQAFKSYRSGRKVESKYVHDAFDRVSWQEEKHAGATTARRTDFNFLGLSSEITTETQSGSGTGTKSYSYDAFGARVGITTGGSSYTYGRNSHGDISLLIAETGGAQASYAYSPYGANSGVSRGDTSTTEPLNPFRFNDKRFDSGSGSIDMGARRYGPDTGRFLSQDFYRTALADLDLATDPLTGNRYSYAGGNPINFIEVDGHNVTPSAGGGARACVFLDENGSCLESPCQGWGGMDCSVAAGPIKGGRLALRGIARLARFLGWGRNAPKALSAIRVGKPAIKATDLGRSEVSRLLRAATRPSKGGHTAVGRAVQKHSMRAGGRLPKALAKASPAFRNSWGKQFTEWMLTDSRSTIRRRLVGTLKTEVWDVHSYLGVGARWNAQTGKFMGYLENVVP